MSYVPNAKKNPATSGPDFILANGSISSNQSRKGDIPPECAETPWELLHA